MHEDKLHEVCAFPTYSLIGQRAASWLSLAHCSGCVATSKDISLPCTFCTPKGHERGNKWRMWWWGPTETIYRLKWQQLTSWTEPKGGATVIIGATPMIWTTPCVSRLWNFPSGVAYSAPSFEADWYMRIYNGAASDRTHLIDGTGEP